MQKILSISVAAFNMEKYIAENLESFIESGCLSDVEIIVTDDGSTDTTPEIVKKYAEKYPDSIKLIIQKNQGPGSTVTSGIKNATGKYFRMVDSDDKVSPENFAKFVGALKNTDADMIVTPFYTLNEKTGEMKISRPDCQYGKTLLFDECALDFWSPMHGISFKTEIFRKNNIRISNGFYTDNEYFIYPASYCKTVLFLDTPVYIYRVALSGQSMDIKSMQKHFSDHKTVLFNAVDFYEKLKESNSSETSLKFALREAVRLAGSHMAILISYKPDSKRKKDYYSFTEELSEKSPDTYKMLLKTRTGKILSYKFTFKAVSFLYRLKNHIK